MLCIDCGGVLTKYGSFKYEGEDIYKATMEGAWAFLLLWQAAYGEDAVKIISKVNWFTRKEKPFHSASPQNSNATPKPKPKPKGKPKPKSKGKAKAKGKAKGQKRKAAEMDQEDAGGCEDEDADEDQEEQEQEEEDIWDPLNDGEENIG